MIAVICIGLCIGLCKHSYQGQILVLGSLLSIKMENATTRQWTVLRERFDKNLVATTENSAC